MNNLEALEALEQSAIEQEQRLNNTIAEIHQERLNSLEKNLIAMYKTKLLNSNPNTKVIVITMILSLLVGILVTTLIFQYLNKENWIVPKQMKYTQEKIKYITVPKAQVIWDKKKKNIYIELKD